MSAPPCVCGDGLSLHPERLDRACIAADCDCEMYEPNESSGGQALPVTAGPAPKARPEPERSESAAPRTSLDPGPTVEQLLRAGRRSPRKSVVKLVDRIEAAAKDLRGRLDEERAKTEAKRLADEKRSAARAEVHRLEKALAEARRLAGIKSGRSATPGDCPECGKSFGSAQAIGTHRARAHAYRKASS